MGLPVTRAAAAFILTLSLSSPVDAQVVASGKAKSALAGVCGGIRLDKTEPSYSADTLALPGIAEIRVRCNVTAKGHSHSCTIEQGWHTAVENVVLAAASKWRVAPLIIDGRPEPCSFTTTVLFPPATEQNER